MESRDTRGVNCKSFNSALRFNKSRTVGEYWAECHLVTMLELDNDCISYLEHNFSVWEFVRCTLNFETCKRMVTALIQAHASVKVRLRCNLMGARRISCFGDEFC